MILITKTSDQTRQRGMYVCMVITWQSMDQPGKVANPARGQLHRENEYFPVPVSA